MPGGYPNGGQPPLTQGDLSWLFNQQPQATAQVPASVPPMPQASAPARYAPPAMPISSQSPVPMPPQRPADLSPSPYGALPDASVFDNIGVNPISGANAAALMKSRLGDANLKRLAAALVGTISPGQGMLTAAPPRSSGGVSGSW